MATRTRNSKTPTSVRALEVLEAAGANVTLELDGAEVALSRLDKVLWPASPDGPQHTRRDYMRYLLRMAPYLLAHLRDRPLTLIRQPEGVSGRRFVHFHYEQQLPEYVETLDIYSEKAGLAEQYLLCNNAATLLWLAHVGSLEFHCWHSRARVGSDAKGLGTDYASSLAAVEGSTLNFPDFVVCDLDPYLYSGREAKGAQPEFHNKAFEQCKEVAFELKSLLDSMGLHSWVKTSGQTGLHVLVSVKRTITFEAARGVAQALGKHLTAKRPELITMEPSTNRRTGKVFFDYTMNARVKTLIAPYSPRGIHRAPIAMPLAWKELAGASPLDFTMETVPGVVEKRGDRWADILQKKQDMAAALHSAIAED